MKRLLPLITLPVCPSLVAAQRAQAAVQASRGHGFDGAFPGAPVS